MTAAFLDTPAPSRWGPLRHRSFRWLWVGATVDSLGGAMTPVALAFAVLDLGGSAAALGLVIAAVALAEVLTTLFGGVLGDRVSRAAMMVGSNVVAALVHGVIAWALIGHWASIGLLAGLGFLGGVVVALAGPSSSAVTPLTVPAVELPAAVALRRLGSNGAMIVGFAGAGIVVAGLGSGVAVAVDAASYLLAGLCYAMLRVPGAGTGPRTPMTQGLVEGAREVFRHTWLWVLITQAFTYHLFYGGVQGVLGPIVVGAEFGRQAWGWSLSVLMAGFVVGGLVTLRWRPRRALVVGVAALSLTACFPLAIAWSVNLPIVLAGAFLHGFGLEIFSVWWDVSIQQNVAPERLSRVYSFDMVGSFAFRPIGLVLTGAVADRLGDTRWLVVVGLVMGGTSLLALLVPDVRRLQRTG